MLHYVTLKFIKVIFMARKKQVTYKLVEDTANELKKQGIGPTARAIRDRIGLGSHSTLMDYLRQWETNEANAANVDSLSEGFTQAIRAEFGRLIQATRDKLE